MQDFNQYGSFLVRNNEISVGKYSLVIRNVHGINRYRIRFDNGRFFLKQGVTFKTIQELVEYYKRQAAGYAAEANKDGCWTSELSVIGTCS